MAFKISFSNKLSSATVAFKSILGKLCKKLLFLSRNPRQILKTLTECSATLWLYARFFVLKRLGGSQSSHQNCNCEKLRISFSLISFYDFNVSSPSRHCGRFSGVGFSLRRRNFFHIVRTLVSIIFKAKKEAKLIKVPVFCL
jgi:hypothetical protein